MLDQEIREYTDQIWRQVLRLEVSPLEGDDVDADSLLAKEGVTAAIQFTGDSWSGACLLHFSITTAARLAASLLELEVEEVDVKTRDDAMGELTNMLGGNLKPFLPGPLKLSLPTVSAGEGAHLKFPKTATRSRCFFESSGETFMITLLEKTP